MKKTQRIFFITFHKIVIIIITAKKKGTLFGHVSQLINFKMHLKPIVKIMCTKRLYFVLFAYFL